MYNHTQKCLGQTWAHWLFIKTNIWVCPYFSLQPNISVFFIHFITFFNVLCVINNSKSMCSEGSSIVLVFALNSLLDVGDEFGSVLVLNVLLFIVLLDSVHLI